MKLIIYFVPLVLGICTNNIMWLHTQIPFNDFWKLIIELLGSFIVTFLGVYISIQYSKKQDEHKEKIKSENYLKSSLILISSEIDFNIDVLEHIVQGLQTMPENIKTYYNTYGMLIEVSKSVKSKAYYASFMTQSIHELIQKLNLFNNIQIGYNNMELAINGLFVTRNVFYDYSLLKPEEIIPQELINGSKTLILSEISGISRSIDRLQMAKNDCDVELDKFNLRFSKEEKH